jgi:hypothetical protein
LPTKTQTKLSLDKPLTLSQRFEAMEKEYEALAANSPKIEFDEELTMLKKQLDEM